MIRIHLKAPNPCHRFPPARWAIAGCLVIGLAISMLAGGLASAQESSLDLSNAWFQPELTIDDAPICDGLLTRVRESFFSVDPLPPVSRNPQAWFPDMEPVDLDELVESEPAIDGGSDDTASPGAEARHFIVSGGRKVYLEHEWSGGCGGRCESTIFFTSNRPFPYERRRTWDSKVDAHRLAIPSYQYSLLRSVDEELYIASRGYGASAYAEQGALTAYRLADDASWVKACEVLTEPGDLRKSGNPNVRSFLTSLDALQDALANIARGEGPCGTLNASNAGYRYRTAALEMAVYRPWASFASGNTPDQRGRTAHEAWHLENWAATGISEHEALRNYRTQLADTGARLADFYERQFGWPQSQAESVANVVLTTSIGFAFPSGYDPFVGGAVRELRRAILESRPLAEIRAIDIDLAGINGDTDPQGESVLNAAVRNLDVLRYLLERGADPNRANAFGKTPLMYAAQYGDVEAAELLLDFGADPNAKTVFPSDRCYYALNTASMTPLHYAVRYASAEFVRLLVDRGAVPYIRTSTHDLTDAYPLDWLRIHNSPESGEQNVRIADDEVPELAALLAVPSADWLADFTRRMTLQAEAEYARGNADTAYDALRRALQAEPYNERALSDLALVSMRAGRIEEAADAASLVIGTAKDPNVLASAWFNLGLACENVQPFSIPSCRYSQVYPFLQSWLTEPAAARADAIARVFGEHATCAQRGEDGSVRTRYLHSPLSKRDSGNEYRYRLYARHPAGSEISADTITWARPGDKKVPAELVTRHEIGESVVSVFNAAGLPPFRVGDMECGPVRN